ICSGIVMLRNEVTVDEAAQCPLPALGDADQIAGLPGRGLVVRKGEGFEVVRDAAAAFCGIHAVQALGKRAMLAGLAQAQRLAPSQQRFDGLPGTGPEFDLPGDRALGDLCREARIRNQAIGEPVRLTHNSCRVAKRYPSSSGAMELPPGNSPCLAQAQDVVYASGMSANTSTLTIRLPKEQREALRRSA